MQVENDCDKEVYNGDLGGVTRRPSTGSEYPSVVIPLMTRAVQTFGPELALFAICVDFGSRAVDPIGVC